MSLKEYSEKVEKCIAEIMKEWVKIKSTGAKRLIERKQTALVIVKKYGFKMKNIGAILAYDINPSEAELIVSKKYEKEN
jgi:hypothetical protein